MTFKKQIERDNLAKYQSEIIWGCTTTKFQINPTHDNILFEFNIAFKVKVK